MGKILKPKPLKSILNIRKFYDQRNKILIFRKQGGLGDVLMHRMIFEDFKKLSPETHITFACPSHLLDSVRDHPFVDDFKASDKVNIDDYCFYNTSFACVRHETTVAPFSDKHRSDIWAEHCGVKLTSHNMHIRISDKEKEYGEHVKYAITKGKPSIVICPTSAMPGKNLLDHQIDYVIKGVKDLGLIPYVSHSNPIPKFKEMNVTVLYGQSIRQWMGIINAADYVLSVDTASFHLAGGLGKPLCGIFTWADGVTYGKYYDFILVQKHRKNGDWNCGPCYKWPNCPLTKNTLKPCLTELTGEMIMDGVRKMINKWPIKDK